ncbi:guanine deaminase-like isoform X2 [Sinocyclocheilus rhinocerous]|nr:PREDICTED: guanine deaminase-like isoform X2 [Sinocyclocheilus rhinocerous]
MWSVFQNCGGLKFRHKTVWTIYSYTGIALDLPLLEWLNTYTFPVEAKYKDLEFANNVYTKVVRRTVKNGPTTACYFATIHTDASLLLGELADKFGQRALVGKVCMDSNSAVPQYKESPSECKEETDRFIKELLKKEYPKVKPVVTPRFAPSCSSSLLSELGEITNNNKLHIQAPIRQNAFFRFENTRCTTLPFFRLTVFN